jgi:fermentation-respiration switch protein FrsA (DUF1100 family)
MERKMTTNIKVKDGKGAKAKRIIEFEYNFGNNLAEAMKLFDHAVIFEKFKDAAIVTLQANARNQMREGGGRPGKEGYKSDATIAKEMSAHKLTVGKNGDPVKKKDRIVKSFATMSTSERLQAMAELQKLVAPAKPALVKGKKAA